jgi:hypothetical protein
MSTLTTDQFIAALVLAGFSSLLLVAALWVCARAIRKVLRWRKFYHLHRGRH